MVVTSCIHNAGPTRGHAVHSAPSSIYISAALVITARRLMPLVPRRDIKYATADAEFKLPRTASTQPSGDTAPGQRTQCIPGRERERQTIWVMRRHKRAWWGVQKGQAGCCTLIMTCAGGGDPGWTHATLAPATCVMVCPLLSTGPRFS